MGSSTDVMRTFIAREIAANYSQNDGWSVEQASTITGYNQILSLMRFHNGMKETVKMGVCLDREVSREFVDKVQNAVAAAQGPAQAGLLIAKNAVVAPVPSSWNVKTMQAFGYEGESLVWYKNPARRIKPAPAQAA